MVVHLYRKLLAGFDGDALDLITLAVINGVVDAPRPVDFAMVGVLVTLAALELVNNLLHVLYMVLVRDQHRILGFHDDQVFHANGGH